jgi:hypothetical protein
MEMYLTANIIKMVAWGIFSPVLKVPKAIFHRGTIYQTTVLALDGFFSGLPLSSTCIDRFYQSN